MEQEIASALQTLGSIEVIWLYGSRATGKYSASSDFDLAIALPASTADRRQLIEDWRYQLSQRFEHDISIVDINKTPTPLALNIINDGRVLMCNDNLRLRAEQRRIWSLWEEYKYEYERIRKQL